MNDKIKILLLFLFFLSGKVLSQITPFTMTVTTVTQSCEGNGKINFNISGTQNSATFDFAIYKSTDLVTPVRVTAGVPATSSTLSHTESTLQDGTYYVVATQSFGGSTNQKTQNNVIITDTTTPISFTVSQTTMCTNYNVTATVTSGTAVTYSLYDTSNNIVKPAQASNTFTNVPAGSYVVVATNACGDGYSLGYTVIADSAVYTVIRTNYNTVGFNEMYNCNFIEHYEKIDYNGTFAIPTSKFPITVVITIQNPITGVPTVINQTWNSTADNGTQQVLIPYYNGYSYNYNVKIYDACSSTTPIINKDDTINANLAVYKGINNGACGGKYISLNDFFKEYGDVNITFTNYPAGFDPATYNSSYVAGTYTHTFTAPMPTSVFFGSVNQTVPEGDYTILVESCGRTVPLSFTVTNYNSDILFPIGAWSGCDVDEGTVGFFIRTTSGGDQVDNLVSIKITSAPAEFVSQYGALPYDVSANIASDGKFYMNSLPLGTYVFNAVGTCGKPLSYTLTLQESFDFTSNYTLNCGSFNVSASLTSYLGNEYLYLQKYYPASGLWGHPTNPTWLQNTGAIVDYGNARQIAAQGGNGGLNTISGTLTNLVGTGDYRIVLRSSVYGNGVIAAASATNVSTSGYTYCEKVLKTFTIPTEAITLNSYQINGCLSGQSELIMDVIGVAPLNYAITAFNGNALSIVNGTNPVFSQLTPGLYDVKVTNGCNATRTFQITVGQVLPPVITPANLCNGQTGTLTLNGPAYLGVSWTKDGSSTVIATGNTLTFNNFNAATDAGIYHATLSYAAYPTSCLNGAVLDYEVLSTQPVPEAGTGQTVNISIQNNTNVINLFDHITGTYDNYGTWTDLSNTGYLSGSILNASSLALGTYQFQYSVNGTCSGTDTTIVTVVIFDPCAVTSTNPDSDGDGISNACDLDDDNDGIKDIDEECYQFRANNTTSAWKGTTSSNLTVTTNTNAAVDSTINYWNDTQVKFLSGSALGADGWLSKYGYNVNMTYAFSTPVKASEAAFAIFDADANGTNELANTSWQITVYDENNNVVTPSNYFAVDGTMNWGYPTLISNLQSGLILPKDYVSNDQALMLKGYGNQLISKITIVSTGIVGDFVGYSLYAYKACDTDGDGIPNRLDLDSDGDGCPDAIEGAGSIKYNQLATNTSISGSVNTTIGNASYGVPSLAGTGQAIGTSQDAATSECCTVSSSGYPDGDGDGVADICDLDNDNDGILDTVECSASPISFGSTSIAAGGTPVTFTQYANGSSLNNNLTVSAPYAVVGNPTNIFVNGQGSSIFRMRDDNGATAGTSYASDLTFAYKTKVTLATVSGTNSNLNQADQITFTAPNATGNVWEVVSSNYAIISNNGNSITIKGNSSSGPDLAPYVEFNIRSRFAIDKIIITHGILTTISTSFNSVQFAVQPCINTDGDSLPNFLDLDSDNDGCLDAIEGGENVTSSMLLTAGGTVTVGTGSNALNQNLCASGTCVDSNGVPVLVNTGGAADTGSATVGTQGQGIGTSANSLAVECATPFTCSNTFYVSQSPSATTATTLYTVNTTANPFTFTAVGDNSHGYVYNAMGFKTSDGFIYAMRYDSSAGATLNNQLLKISSDGKVYNLGAISGLSGSVTYDAGAFDSSGNYYIRPTNSSLMYKIDVSTRTLLSTINLKDSSNASVTVNTGDLAFNTSDSMFYGVDSITSKLVKIDPSTGLVTYGTGTTNSSQYGAMWGSGSGHIYGSANDGSEFAQFNVTSGTSTKISNVQSTFLSDGATCIGVTAVLALATDLEITKTDGITNYTPGTTTTYTIVAKNNGPFGVVDAVVADALPAGITTMSYYAVASSGSSTNVTGTSTSPQTGAINDKVSLPVGGTVTYTATVTIPSTFTGSLVNTATITAPSTATENLTSNNTATDTDGGVCYNDASTVAATGVTNHGITLLKRAGANNGNWPMNRTSAHTVLESNTKGFVITRMTTAQINLLVAVEGMMVYDTDQKCLKLYDGTAWSCFSTPACP